MTPEPSAYLSISGLAKRFGNFTALEDIDLEVAQGEFVCFLGPSGCGKTTLLRAIAGLDIQDEGRILMAGRDVSTATPAMRDFGIVFQSYALFPNLTVADNVGYGLVNRGQPRTKIEARVTELLELVGLPDQGPKYPLQLSGGQQQRVALARALATSPGLLLLDEPLSALDARVRVHLREQIRDLQKRLGVTTIMVTHDQEEALTMADRIVVMRAGRIEQVGSGRDLYERPASRFVAEFIGRLNVLPLNGAAPNLTLPLPAGAGRPGAVGIRPEAVRLHAEGTQGANHVPVQVAQVVFLGNLTQLVLDAGPDWPPFVAETQGAGARAAAPGAALVAELPAEALQVLEWR